MREKQARRRRRRLLAYAGVTAAWAVTVWLSTVLAPPDWLHGIALFVHVGALVIGLGAVLMIEWHALLWATGWSNVRELRQADRTMILPVWVGLGGLLASGALLEPDLGRPATLVKLGAVLVLSLNGVALTRWTHDLARLPANAHFRSLPRGARVGFVTSAVVSQAAWWTAVVIGLVNSTA
ncbi:hypothetical protein ACFPER_04480 [Agromyces aurantiacus]|uniref:Copper resistance protein D domain-containing protein n=1 Tax=Agromyces aurantiacus TaxID=165814 RepID=A0ABV9R3L2_9MICO|nr:hypothetical protein [Agromyces aurantiacus]MBM7502714.1 hypothetical protein [Agromyces aurantiacus]